MDSLDTQTYCPTLRLKFGECSALSELRNDVRMRILPLFVIPPPKEPDPELRRQLTVDELLLIPARRLGDFWPMRPCLLDPSFLTEALGIGEAVSWLPRLFEMAKQASANPWLVCELRQAENGFGSAVAALIRAQRTPIAIRVRLEDLEHAELTSRLQRLLLGLVVKPADVILLLDFDSPDYSDVELFSDVLIGTLQRVLSIGQWRQVIWRSTSFPEKNPAPAGKIVTIPRSEWLVHQHAFTKSLEVRKFLMFGDYGADSAKFVFGSVPVRPFPHFRYSTSLKWLVSRGASTSTDSEAMKFVADMIVHSGSFFGAGYSTGDEFIFEVSESRGGPGNPSIWRRVNTVHHLTLVAADQGGLHGYQISRREFGQPWTQASLDFTLPASADATRT
jgi:Beta protein